MTQGTSSLIFFIQEQTTIQNIINLDTLVYRSKTTSLTTADVGCRFMVTNDEAACVFLLQNRMNHIIDLSYCETYPFYRQYIFIKLSITNYKPFQHPSAARTSVSLRHFLDQLIPTESTHPDRTKNIS